METLHTDARAQMNSWFQALIPVLVARLCLNLAEERSWGFISPLHGSVSQKNPEGAAILLPVPKETRRTYSPFLTGKYQPVELP